MLFKFSPFRARTSPADKGNYSFLLRVFVKYTAIKRIAINANGRAAYKYTDLRNRNPKGISISTAN